MKAMYHDKGYTLIELMVVVGIVTVLAGIAIPVYNGYISTSAASTTRSNADALSGFEDTYFYENDSYLAGVYDPPGTDTLTAALSWKPTGDQDNFRYVVTAGTTGDIATSYTITVTYKADTSITAVVQRP